MATTVIVGASDVGRKSASSSPSALTSACSMPPALVRSPPVRSRTAATASAMPSRPSGRAAQRVADGVGEAGGQVAQLGGDVAQQPGQGLEQERRVEDRRGELRGQVVRHDEGERRGEPERGGVGVDDVEADLAEVDLVAARDEREGEPGARERVAGGQRVGDLVARRQRPAVVVEPGDRGVDAGAADRSGVERDVEAELALELAAEHDAEGVALGPVDAGARERDVAVAVGGLVGGDVARGRRRSSRRMRASSGISSASDAGDDEAAVGAVDGAVPVMASTNDPAWAENGPRMACRPMSWASSRAVSTSPVSARISGSAPGSSGSPRLNWPRAAYCTVGAPETSRAASDWSPRLKAMSVDGVGPVGRPAHSSTRSAGAVLEQMP